MGYDLLDATVRLLTVDGGALGTGVCKSKEPVAWTRYKEVFDHGIKSPD